MPTPAHGGHFRIGDWTADPALDVVRRGSQVAKLEPRTMRVLQYLAARPLQVVAPTELEEFVWKGVVVTPQSVYQSIAHLRRVFGDDARQPRYIETVPRKGYRLVAAVEWLPAGAIDVPKSSREPTPEAPALTTTRAPWRRLAAGLAIAIAVLGLTWFAYREWRSDRAPESFAVAVLPFADLSPDKSNVAFCDGLTVELMSLLAQIPELRVTARNSAFVYRDREADAREIGKQLGVSHVLEGSVRRDDRRVRITATLVDTRSGFTVLSRVFDQPTGEILRIQEDIARDVVDSLRIELSPASAARIARNVTADVGAYELYLLGRYHMLQRTPQALNRAARYQQDAITQDPNFALAYAGLADAQMARYYYDNLPLDEAARAVETLVNRALELDPQLAEAHAARAVLRIEQTRTTEAIADLEKAVALKPNYAEALIRLGAAREYRGEQHQALAALDQAMDLDPLHFILHIRRCLVLQNLGRYDAANQACGRAVELDPNVPNGYWTTGLIALSRGDLPGAIAGYRRALEKAPWRTDLSTQLGWLLLDIGAPGQARVAFDNSLAHEEFDKLGLQLERARWYVATASRQELASHLAGLDVPDSTPPGRLLEVALLEFVAGNVDRGCKHAERAAAATENVHATFAANVWDARWGRNDLMTLATCARARAEDRAADAHLEHLRAWLDQLESRGNVWHGLHYLRAGALSLQGHAAEALRELERAVALGWRRAWWMRMDPAFDALRQDQRFRAMIARVDALNAQARKGLPTATEPER